MSAKIDAAGERALAQDALRAAFHEQGTPVIVPAGTTLIREGGSDDDLYLVVSGRLRVSSGGSGTMVADAGPGQLVGEMALLGDGRRVASVRAVRDSEVLRLGRRSFERLALRDHELLARVSTVALQRFTRPGADRSGVRTVAVVPAGSHAVDLDAVGQSLADALGAHGSATAVSSRRVAAELSPKVAQAEPLTPEGNVLAAWLDGLESAHRVVIYLANRRLTEWSRRCLRQADLVLHVGDTRGDPSLGPVERAALDLDVQRHLVLLHPPGAGLPAGTARWLEHRTVHGRHHVRTWSREDFSRLARHVSGSAIGLVLGGGGARGFAHLGVFRALEDSGVPIDSVGGTSIGAIMGALLAMGCDPETRIALATSAFGGRHMMPPTLPVVAYSSSRRMTRLIENAFGDTRIEDLWLPFFCVSTSLTSAAPYVHDQGPVWLAVRASASLPGLLPPVWLDGELLVDGGVVDNLPVQTMHERLAGRIIAVDIEPAPRQAAVEPFPPTISGWAAAARRLTPFRRARIPGVLETLMRARAVAVTASRQLRHDDQLVELTLHPNVSHVSALDFRAALPLVRTAYRDVSEAIQASRLGSGAATAVPYRDQSDRVQAPDGTRREADMPVPSLSGRPAGATARAPTWLITVRDLLWRRRRFTVALIGTSLVLSLALTLAGVSAGFPNEARRTVHAFHAGAWLVPEGTSGPFMSSATLPAGTADSLAADGAGAAAPVAILRATMRWGGHHPDVNVLGIRPGSFTDPPVVQGRPPRQPDEATVDTRLGARIGASVDINGHTYRVVGRTSGLSYRAGVGSVYITLDQAQAIAYGGKPLATAIALQHRPTRIPPGFALRSNSDTRHDLLAPLVNARKTINLVLAILWIVAGLVIGSVVYLSTLDRVRDFAVFKAIGAADRALVQGVLLQAVVLGGAATIVGIILSAPLARTMPMRAEVAGAHYVTLVVLALAVSGAASLAAIRRVRSVDPALAFGSPS